MAAVSVTVLAVANILTTLTVMYLGRRVSALEAAARAAARAGVREEIAKRAAERERYRQLSAQLTAAISGLDTRRGDR